MVSHKKIDKVQSHTLKNIHYHSLIVNKEKFKKFNQSQGKKIIGIKDKLISSINS